LIAPEFSSVAELHQHYVAVLSRTRGSSALRRQAPAVLIAAPAEPSSCEMSVEDGPIRLLEGVSAPIDMIRTRGYKFLIAYVAAKTGVSVDEIVGPVQSRSLVAARHAAMAMCVTHTRHSISKIGAAFNKDHTTVSYVIAKQQLKRPGEVGVRGRKFKNPHSPSILSASSIAIRHA
jgi:hypothetical protein